MDGSEIKAMIFESGPEPEDKDQQTKASDETVAPGEGPCVEE